MPVRTRSHSGLKGNNPFATPSVALTKTSSTQRASACTPRPFWRESALCSGMTVDLFFGGNDGLPQSMRQIEMAKAVCRQCPVQQDCLIFALQRHEPHGVWGGMARHERERAMTKHGGDVAAVVQDYEARVLLGSLEEQ
jgi:WhiB family transcriptional regulator, redox-sensing transcriptional regulator